MTVRNAGNGYPQLSRDAALMLAEIRSFVWADIDQMKNDISDFDARLPVLENRVNALDSRVSSLENRVSLLEGQMVTKAMLDSAVSALHEKSNASNQNITSNATLIKTLSDALGSMQKKLDEVSQQAQRALSSTESAGTLMENKILSMRQNDVSQDTLRDLPAKISALTERIASMEKRWFAFIVIGTPVAAIIVNLASFWLKGLFSHP